MVMSMIMNWKMWYLLLSWKDTNLLTSQFCCLSLDLGPNFSLGVFGFWLFSSLQVKLIRYTCGLAANRGDFVCLSYSCRVKPRENQSSKNSTKISQVYWFQLFRFILSFIYDGKCKDFKLQNKGRMKKEISKKP